jgi:hypothetical protein
MPLRSQISLILAAFRLDLGLTPNARTATKKYNALLKAGERHGVEKTGEKLRSLMPWTPKRSIKGVQAAY